MNNLENLYRQDGYLLIKRGLYYRPKASGYTGVKSEAGRYTREDAASRIGDGVSAVHESDAEEYAPACPWDVKMKREAWKDGVRDAAEAIRRKMPFFSPEGPCTEYDWGYGEGMYMAQKTLEEMVAPKPAPKAIMGSQALTRKYCG